MVRYKQGDHLLDMQSVRGESEPTVIVGFLVDQQVACEHVEEPLRDVMIKPQTFSDDGGRPRFIHGLELIK